MLRVVGTYKVEGQTYHLPTVQKEYVAAIREKNVAIRAFSDGERIHRATKRVEFLFFLREAIFALADTARENLSTQGIRERLADAAEYLGQLEKLQTQP